MVKQIQLTRNQIALVDDEDFEYLSSYKWQACKNGYADRSISRLVSGKNCSKRSYMHREIMGNPGRLEVDHKNGNRLDNRKSNLRLCSRAQNQMNRIKSSNKTSKYKGVSWQKCANKWMVYIKIDQKRYYLGIFISEKEAAKSYNKAAMKNFGKFAKLNVIK